MTAGRRVFEHHQIWRVNPDSLREATTLLAGAILRDHQAVQHVIGIAHGGVAPARMIAAALGLKARTVHARHNTSDTAYQQATGKVTLDLDPLTRTLNGQRMKGRVLVVDDICGSGATLRHLRHELAPLLSPSAQLLTAVLCLNAGAARSPDYSVWTVSDWVVFPWEKPPADQDTNPLPLPEKVDRHV
ncbi:hypothetical protein ATK36_5394 [Amycolatopsis sulphurea]|uniref:Phosphoribosyltransferase domain-containing protein n=1 Tax=Amycolatopsis sulphurea TaxID=76022 RepID=A0A2A9FIB5_9PSEU|nr:phosphoribosyltransferase family protein [Amycolatopsis sulphurea]PFG50185.1 hypothetical protein ATK36_5394 [Amycolatopsis sulphurea]